jgi:opacity protein-like surface antigen
MMKKFTAMVLTMIMTAAALTGCGGAAEAPTEDTAAERTTFTVGFDAEYPPYGYRTESGDYAGFDLDLAAEVCARQGWELVKQPIDWSVRYKGEVNLGFAVTGSKTDWEYDYTMSYNGYTESESGESKNIKTVFSRPLIETIHGVAIGPYFFVGAGIGLQYYCGKLKDFQMNDEQAASIGISKPAKRWNAVMLPIFADIKFMYPLNNDFTPYIDLGLGGTVACTSALNFSYSGYGESSQKLRGGFYCNFGVGFHYKKLNVSLGLQHQGLKIAGHYKYKEYYETATTTEDSTLSTKVNAFYIKVGVNF